MVGKSALVGLSWLLVCCGGRSTNTGDSHAGGAGAESAVAGGVGQGGALNVAGAPVVIAGGSSAGGVSAGGSSAGGPPVEIAGGAGTAGSDNMGGSGAVVDYSHARWPMPNSIRSGLPHPANFDSSTPDVMTDRVTGLMWEKSELSVDRTLAEAINHCDQLSLAGYQDWRLPSRIELASLVAVADELDPSTDFPLSGDLVSSSVFMPPLGVPLSGPQHWIVNISLGLLSFVDEDSTEGTAVCVRSAVTAPVDSAAPARLLTADTVTDTGTGLVWERAVQPVWATYAASKAHCTGLSLGGYRDWRIPSIPEMLTISEPDRIWPSINTSDFPGPDTVESGWFWSATPYFKTGPAAYAPGLNFGGLTDEAQSETAPCLVRCVR